MHVKFASKTDLDTVTSAHRQSQRIGSLFVAMFSSCERNGSNDRNLSSRNTRSTIRHSSPTGKRRAKGEKMAELKRVVGEGRRTSVEEREEKQKKEREREKERRKRRRGTKLRSGGRKQRGRNLIHPARPGRTKDQTHTDINSL